MGAVFDAPTQPVALVFASEFAYMAAMDGRPVWDKTCRHTNLIHGGNVRNLLRTQPDGVYVPLFPFSPFSLASVNKTCFFAKVNSE